MNRPGSRLRAFAVLWLAVGTMTRVVDPLIADLWLLMNVVPWNLRAPTYVAAWLPNATIVTLAAVFGILSAWQASRRLSVF
jgi:hypothetical protein